MRCPQNRVNSSQTGGWISSTDCPSYPTIVDLTPAQAGSCYAQGTILGPYIYDTCGSNKTQPSAPTMCSTTSNATRDGSGSVGDPVDLTTGALSLDPTDLDLGGGLRFSRHYASNATNVSSSQMGFKWAHSLDWRIKRNTTSGVGIPIIVVWEPLKAAVPFVFDGTAYRTSWLAGGSLTVDGSGNVSYKGETGVEADFDSLDRLTQIRHPGELPIHVTRTTNTTTFTRGTQSIVVTRFASGTANSGRVSTVVANGETWTYTYVSGYLKTVVGPDPSTASTTDSATWTYTYTTSSSGLITSLDRVTTAGSVNLGTWAYNGSRVSSADEQGLDQLLNLAYSTPQSGTFRATVTDSSAQLLALFDSRSSSGMELGVVTSVTNPSGPASPVPGGAGVPVPFIASTTVDSKRPLVKTRTDKRGNVTLFENYDADGRPGRSVKGWIDGPAQPGVFSADDSYAALEETVWHPVLRQPLLEYEPSVMPGGGTRTTISDYDDPAAPGDNPTIPNEAPTNRLYSRTEQGYTFDASGNSVLAALETTYTYDSAGRIKTESGPRPENFTEHFYDPTTGYRTATRHHLNGSTSSYLETVFSNFDSRGNPQSITDANLQATQFTYDTLQRVKTVTPPFSGASSTITFTYDIDGNLTRVDFPPDSFAQPYFLQFGYDAKNRLTFLADAAGNAIVYERAAGRVTREALYSGFVSLSNRGTLTGDSTFSYDAAGRLLKAFNPLFAGNSVFTQYGSDPNGNPATVTDENGKQDTRIYDALDRLKQVSQVRGATTYVTQFDYDLLGSMKRVTDPAAKATDYQHDDFGRLVEVTSPNTGVTLFTYDAAGNLSAKTENFTGTPRTTTYAYDGLDRLTLIDLPTQADWTFTYDTSLALNQMGRLSTVSNGLVTTTREYTPRGDLARESTTVGGVSHPVTYGYDAGGNRISVQAPSGVTASYAYSGGRPKTLTVTAGADQQIVRNIAFAPFDGRTRAEFPPFNSGTGLNTVVSTRTYNLRGQASALQVTSPAGTVLDQSFDYAYTSGGAGPVDAGPNLDQTIDHRDANESRFYFYDDLDRLWKATSLAGSAIYTYTYDANGNRIGEVAPGVALTTTYEVGTDRIAQSAGTTPRNYVHDVFGNRIWADATSYAGLPAYLYDEQNRLAETRNPATQAVIGQYAYDAFGRRVRKITASGTTLFFYDDSGHLVEERSLATLPNSVRDFVWIEEEPVGVVDSGPLPTKFSWIHTERLGTPLAATSSPSVGSAQTIWRASYPPFGAAVIDPDPDGDSVPFGLDLRFPGQIWDAETGMHYNWHRYYDPSIGRYISTDPVGQAGGINLYSYAANNPANLFDPDGLAVVINNTGRPLRVTGNPGPGSGTGAQESATIAPGARGGGSENPLPGDAGGTIVDVDFGPSGEKLFGRDSGPIFDATDADGDGQPEFSLRTDAEGLAALAAALGDEAAEQLLKALDRLTFVPGPSKPCEE